MVVGTGKSEVWRLGHQARISRKGCCCSLESRGSLEAEFLPSLETLVFPLRLSTD